MTLLVANGLHRSLNESGRVLLDNVDVSINPGDRIGIVGDSGSGKTTLLRSLAMLDAQTVGQIEFQGQLIADSDIPAYRRRVLYVAQQAGFVDANVRDNLALAFQFVSTQNRLDESQAVAWLAQLGRDASMLEQSARDLSGGERQLVALVRALLVDPTILLLDEPTSAMDAGLTEELEAFIMRWTNENSERAFSWISHDQEQLRRVTNRQLRIKDGCVSEL